MTTSAATQAQGAAPVADSTKSGGLAGARALFPGAQQSAYFDVASRGLMPASAQAVADEHVRLRIFGDADKKKYFEAIEQSRSLFAQLIGAQPHEIAITKNVTEGINAIATSLPWQPGDAVMVCSALEHPANLYPWRNLERRGVRLVDVPAPQGLMPVDDMIARLDAKVRVVAVSATSFRPGLRTGVRRLGAACRANNTLLVVDGAQSVGITHTDVAADGIDVLATSAQKGLCSVYGLGFLYVRESLAQELRPTYLARFGVEIEKTHEADYDPGPIRYRRGALRFDVGNYNFLAAELTAHALELLLAHGTQAIDQHVTRLASTLAARLEQAGIIAASGTAADWANMVCIDMRQPRLRACTDVAGALAARRVRAAVRGNFVRFSAHLYNDDSDIEAAVEAVEAMAAMAAIR
jgi:cysteine desulfurase/selenocysteine lyase